MSVIELGSGPGLAGLLAAKLGAKVVITDKYVVLPLIEENIKLNGISHTPTATCSGTAEVRQHRHYTCCSSMCIVHVTPSLLKCQT
jgi:predicted nicotinamide N-methyase